jgi:hypothetical protein
MYEPDYLLLIYTLQLLLMLPIAERVYRFACDPGEIVSPLTLIVTAFCYLYVAGYYTAASEELATYTTPAALFRLMMLAVLAYYAYILGFAMGLRTPTAKSRPFCYGWSCWYAMALIAAGFAGQLVLTQKFGGFIAFYSEPHGRAADWEQVSAYLYSLPRLMFPGAFLLYAALVRYGLPGVLPRIGVFATLAFYGFQTYVFGNRGDTMRLFLLFVVTPMLLRGRVRLSHFTVLAAAAIALSAVVLFPFLREAVHLGSEKSVVQAMEDIVSDEPVDLDHRMDSGRELFLAAALVDAVSKASLYDLGRYWLYPFVNLVPRFFWPDKPYAFDWSVGIYNLLPVYHPGWILYPGIFPTGVADTFVRFSWFGVLAWFIFGWWGGRLWSNAMTTRGIIEAGYLWAYLMIICHFVAQDFFAGWHAWLFYMVPVWWASFVAAILTGVRGGMPTLRDQPGGGPATASVR